MSSDPPHTLPIKTYTMLVPTYAKKWVIFQRWVRHKSAKFWKRVNICHVSACFHPGFHCPACRTYLIATIFWVVVICPIIKCLTVLKFSFILFDFCLFITIFNSILYYVLIVTFWIFTYHKIWILLIIFCFIWNYWIIYFLTCLEVFLECCELTGVSLLWPWLIKWK